MSPLHHAPSGRNGVEGTGYAAIGGDDERSYGGLLNLGNSRLQGQLNAGHTESGGSRR